MGGEGIRNSVRGRGQGAQEREGVRNNGRGRDEAQWERKG